MSYAHITNKEIKSARKEHECTSCFHIREELKEYPSFLESLSEDHKSFIRDRIQKNWKIQKGESYMISVGTWEGEIMNAKFLPKAHEICKRYNLYPEY